MISGATAAALAFAGLGVGHLVQADATTGLALEWIPMRSLLSPATALLEFALAAGFLFRATRSHAGWIAVAFLIAIFAANVYASPMEPVPLELGVAIQGLLVALIYVSCVSPPVVPSIRSASLN
jgi:uncharacterized membrane protein